jgi:membrane dipeptidase
MDVRRNFEAGIVSLPLGMENGSPIEGDLANLRHFHERGIRYITLAHSLSNHISDSSFDENRQWQGLSEFGVEIVREMNRLGINMSDEMIRALAENGGIIMVNFGSAFITEEARQYSSKRWPAARAFIEEHSNLSREEAQKQFAASWEAENGAMPYASLDDVLNHFDHVVELSESNMSASAPTTMASVIRCRPV